MRAAAAWLTGLFALAFLGLAGAACQPGAGFQGPYEPAVTTPTAIGRDLLGHPCTGAHSYAVDPHGHQLVCRSGRWRRS